METSCRQGISVSSLYPLGMSPSLTNEAPSKVTLLLWKLWGWIYKLSVWMCLFVSALPHFVSEPVWFILFLPSWMTGDLFFHPAPNESSNLCPLVLDHRGHSAGLWGSSFRRGSGGFCPWYLLTWVCSIMWVHIPHCSLACGQKCGRGSGFAKIVYYTFFLFLLACAAVTSNWSFLTEQSYKSTTRKRTGHFRPSIKKWKKGKEWETSLSKSKCGRDAGQENRGWTSAISHMNSANKLIICWTSKQFVISVWLCYVMTHLGKITICPVYDLEKSFLFNVSYDIDDQCLWWRAHSPS